MRFLLPVRILITVDSLSKAQSDAASKGAKLENVERDLVRSERDKNKAIADHDKYVEEQSKGMRLNSIFPTLDVIL